MERVKIIDRRHHAKRNLELEAAQLLDRLALIAGLEPLLLSIRKKYSRTPGAFIERLSLEEREMLKHLKL